MYDKRYSDEKIKRIRRNVFQSTFFCMFLVCIGVFKGAWHMGFHVGFGEGYHARMRDEVITPATSYLPAPAKQNPTATYKVQKASFEIEIIAEPDDLPDWKVMLNWLLSYWIFGWIGIACLAIYKAITYPRKKESPLHD